jgi:hypothetical protein
MLITVIDVSKSIYDLISSEYGDAIAKRANRDNVVDSFCGIVIKNGPTNAISVTNVLDEATVSDGLPIAADSPFSCQLRDLRTLKAVA